MRGRVAAAGIAAALLVAAAAGAADTGAKPDGKAALERLKQLSGEWRGQASAGKDGTPTSVVYALTAGGSTVTERLFPGTAHEMLTVYHLDGGDLVLTHYCAMANQPRMRLVSATGTDPVELKFDFAGGANVDPAKDAHMHAGRLVLRGADKLDAEWAVYEKGKQIGTNKFALERVK
jgi:hypothetical protein